MAAHKYAEACPKFEDSLRLEYGLGTLLNLAVCYEGEGKTASAWSKFLELASKARLAGQAERARIGHDRAAALAPKLSNLVIDVPHSDRSEGLVVQRDGAPTVPTEWGTAIPADPGTHTISAIAPGKKPWSGTVVVPPEAGSTAHVAVPELAPEPAEPVASSAPLRAVETTSPSTSGLPSAKPPRSHAGLGAQQVLAIASGVIGLAGVGVGTYYGLDSLAKHNDAHEVCPGPTCATTIGTNDWHEATTTGNIATIGFIVGGVGIAGGLALWFTAPGPERAGTPTAQIEVAPRMIRLRGTW